MVQVITPSQWTTSTNALTPILLDGANFLAQNADKSYSLTSKDNNTIRFQVEGGDKWTGDGGAAKERSEIADTQQFANGTNISVAYSFMVEPGANNTASWLVMGQFHNNDDTATAMGSPPFTINLVGNKMAVTIGYEDASGQVINQLAYLDPQDIVRGQTYSMQINVTFDPMSQGGNGHLQIIRNGVEIVDYNGPLGDNNSTSYYWKEGIYRSSAPETIAIDYSGLKITSTTPPTAHTAAVSADEVPTVAGHYTQTAHTAAVAAGSLFQATDPSGHAMTAYQFTIETANPTGHFILNGVAVPTTGTFQVSAAQLAQLTFTPGLSSSIVQVRAFDGSLWSNPASFQVQGTNAAPVVTGSNTSIGHGTSVSLASLIKVTDADGDAITSYNVTDVTTGGGHIVVGGVAVAANQTVTLTQAQLSTATFVAGTTTDSLQFSASDGLLSSATTTVKVTGTNQAPVVSAGAVSVTRGTTVSGASVVAVTDADGDAITQYHIQESSAGTGGHFVLNGSALSAGTVYTLTAAQFQQLQYVGGTGTNAVKVAAYDGIAWGGYASYNIVSGSAPTVAAQNTKLVLGTQIAASSLFTAADPNGTIHDIQIAHISGGGVFTINNVAQTSQTTDYTPAQLAQLAFTVSGNDQIQVRVSDGVTWSAWTTVTVSGFIPASGSAGPQTVSYSVLNYPFTTEQDTYSAAGALIHVAREYASGVTQFTQTANADHSVDTAWYDTTGKQTSATHLHADGSIDKINFVVAGQAYTYEDDTYSASGALTHVTREYASGIVQLVQSIGADGSKDTAFYDPTGRQTSATHLHADGSIDKINFVVAGQAYTYEDDTYSASGALTHVTREYASGIVQLVQSIGADGSKDTAFYDTTGRQTSDTQVHADRSTDKYLSNITGQSYVAEHDMYAANGTLMFTDRTNTDGSHSQTAFVAGVTLMSTSAVDKFTSSTAGSDTFVFAAGSGNDTVTAFHAGEGSNHDVLSIAGKGAPANFQAWAQAHLQQVGADTVVHIDAADTITLKSISMSALTVHDFHFA